MDFDDLNPPLSRDGKGEAFFGCLVWGIIFFAIFALIRTCA